MSVKLLATSYRLMVDSAAELTYRMPSCTVNPMRGSRKGCESVPDFTSDYRIPSNGKASRRRQRREEEEKVTGGLYARGEGKLEWLCGRRCVEHNDLCATAGHVEARVPGDSLGQDHTETKKLKEYALRKPLFHRWVDTTVSVTNGRC